MRTTRDPGTGIRAPGSGLWAKRCCAGSLLVGAALAVAALSAWETGASQVSPEQTFREATSLAQSGDYPAALTIYRELAAGGHESGSLYWNWAQVSRARGAVGEALWALLRGRELEPGDTATAREIESLRSALNLDPAELSPSALSGLGRLARRLHLALFATLLLLASLGAHVTARLARALRWPVAAAWLGFALGSVTATFVWLGSLAPPTAVVVRRDVALADAASPTASVLATMREGEAVPVLDVSGPYLHVQDSSGARGWVLVEDVRRLDQALPPAAPPRQ
ncbi:MAG: hypothetical protein LAO05_11480 [Acidobacteriia bacterium]|nr:hypothetical protein [Terriglobia bacterium]